MVSALTNQLLRRIIIGLAGLTALTGLYILYNRYIQTSIPVPTKVLASGEVLQNQAWFRTPGRVGDFQLHGAEGLVYREMDRDGRLIRELGFQQTWYQGRDNWVVRSPFVRLLLNDAECLITADSGILKLDPGIKKAIVRDGTLSGNVTIRLIPKDGSIIPCQMRLDDISMSEQRPGFSSGGLVRFESPQGQLTGRQMELAYNQITQTLGYLRIGRIEQLTWRIGGDARPRGSSSDQPDARLSAAQTYQCLLEDQVLLKTERDLIYASRYVHIIDIAWSRSGSGSQTSNRDEYRSATDLQLQCKGPVTICPMDQQLSTSEPVRTGADMSIQSGPKTQVIASTIQYSAATGRVVAGGPVHIRLLGPDPADPCLASRQLVPVLISSDSQASFDPTEGLLLMDGPCRCVMIRHQGGTMTRYTLLSDRIAALLEDAPISSKVRIVQKARTINADGDPVELRLESYPDWQEVDLIQDSPPAVFGGARLTCRQVSWDAQSQVLTAEGPGTVWINQAGSGQRQEGSNQPFYGLIRQWAVARLNVATERLVAVGDKEPILVDYFPSPGGRKDLHIRAEADQVEIDLVIDQSNQFEVRSLTATGRVYYDDQDNRFVGHKLIYDHATGWMEMAGKDGQPCSANGVAVLGIRFNLKTRQLQTTIVSPGMWLVH